MLDKRTETMLQVASLLTTEDLDGLRSPAPAVTAVASIDTNIATIEPGDPVAAELGDDASTIPAADPAQRRPQVHRTTRGSSPHPSSTAARGEYERQRTRESKISTACAGRERERHDWWPVGTELVGTIGSEQFTAMVVENPQVKSGRSVLITSGAASGKTCHTPTRAAMEATESYRHAHNLGRGGGVTNGWEFWSRQDNS